MGWGHGDIPCGIGMEMGTVLEHPMWDGDGDRDGDMGLGLGPGTSNVGWGGGHGDGPGTSHVGWGRGNTEMGAGWGHPAWDGAMGTVLGHPVWDGDGEGDSPGTSNVGWRCGDVRKPMWGVDVAGGGGTGGHLRDTPYGMEMCRHGAIRTEGWGHSGDAVLGMGSQRDPGVVEGTEGDTKGPRGHEGVQGTTGRWRGQKGDPEATTHHGWPPTPCGWVGSWQSARIRGGGAAKGASMPPGGPGPHGGHTAATSEGGHGGGGGTTRDTATDHNPVRASRESLATFPPLPPAPRQPNPYGAGRVLNPLPPQPPPPTFTEGIQTPTFALLPHDLKQTQPL